MPDKDRHWVPTLSYDVEVTIKDLKYEVFRVEIGSSITIPYQRIILDLFVDAEDIILKQLWGGEPIKMSIRFFEEEKTPLDQIDYELLYVAVPSGLQLPLKPQNEEAQHKDRSPISYLQAVSMGELGVAVPYGIGAKLAKPDKQIIALAGDGAFMINIQDLETAVRLGLKNLIYVIANNNAWGMIKSGQKLAMGKRFIDVDLPEFNFAKCAEGFGCYGEIVTDPKEIKPALDRARNSNKPAVLDVKIAFATPDATKLLLSMGVL